MCFHLEIKTDKHLLGSESFPFINQLEIILFISCRPKKETPATADTNQANITPNRLWHSPYKSFKTSWEYPIKLSHSIIPSSGFHIRLKWFVLLRSTRLAEISQIKAANFLTTCWTRYPRFISAQFVNHYGGNDGKESRKYQCVLGKRNQIGKMYA